MRLKVAARNSADLWPGQMGVAYVSVRDTTLGEYLYTSFRKWISGQVTRNHGM